MFPHYTWGYIVLQYMQLLYLAVPSLYVRVYRKRDEWPKGGHRSLTIREGISAGATGTQWGGGFPHYTWGYIVCFHTVKAVYIVPSLYVRVYRWADYGRNYAGGSLTIREGISGNPSLYYINPMFPHYTWGYINTDRQRQNCRNVPSLYVRVYRRFKLCVNFGGRSLTIREGISPETLRDIAARQFPHYTWGYIDLRFH